MTRLTIDPALCRAWPSHNRAAQPLTRTACADLIDSIRAQGRQEFPAIVRSLPEGDPHRYEIICGLRRHFAVSWLRAQGMEVAYLIEPRHLTDEEAFRLADLENRNRRDISDYERACDYATALETYYGGVQKDMAARLDVSRPWLSRYLQLARLPGDVVAAFADPRDLRERHARQIKALLADPDRLPQIIATAQAMAQETPRPSAPRVLRRLSGPATTRPRAGEIQFRRSLHDQPMTLRKKGDALVLEFPATLRRGALRAAFDQFMAHRFGPIQ